MADLALMRLVARGTRDRYINGPIQSDQIYPLFMKISEEDNKHIFSIDHRGDKIDKLIMEYPEDFDTKQIRNIKINDEKADYQIKNNYIYLCSNEINIVRVDQKHELEINYHNYPGNSPDVYANYVYLETKENPDTKSKIKYDKEPEEFKLENRLDNRYFEYLNFPKVISCLILDYLCPAHVFIKHIDILKNSERFLIPSSKKYFIYGDTKKIKSISIEYNGLIFVKIDTYMLLILNEIYRFGSKKITRLPFPKIDTPHHICIEYHDKQDKVILAIEDDLNVPEQPSDEQILQFRGLIKTNYLDRLSFNHLTFQLVLIPLIDNQLIEKKNSIIKNIKYSFNNTSAEYFPVDSKFHNYPEPNFEIYTITFQNPYDLMKNRELKVNRLCNFSKIDNFGLELEYNYKVENVSIYIGQISMNILRHLRDLYGLAFSC